MAEEDIARKHFKGSSPLLLSKLINMNSKTIISGNQGSGKTTLASKISDINTIKFSFQDMIKSEEWKVCIASSLSVTTIIVDEVTLSKQKQVSFFKDQFNNVVNQFKDLKI